VSPTARDLGSVDVLSSWDDIYLKFRWSFTAELTVRTENLRRNQMQEPGYARFKIESKPAPHVYPIPNKFDVSARKLRLAAMLAHEASSTVQQGSCAKPTLHLRGFGGPLRIQTVEATSVLDA